MQKKLFDEISYITSKITTKKYSTSFSMGILFLDESIRLHIYNIYGLVRFADEIVDTFQGYNQKVLLENFKADTFRAIKDKISLNPILNSFQYTVNQFSIDHDLILAFFKSMEMDLSASSHDDVSYDQYIVGSAEVVGLMCLKVFVDGNDAAYNTLTPSARSLGAAFQKVNFLRDIKEDYETLGRIYFPNVHTISDFATNKKEIEADIDQDFEHALSGIIQLPEGSKKGVLLAYHYFYELHQKIKKINPEKVLTQRVRISNVYKIWLMIKVKFK
jgi:15-cis-phytoene synthase